MIKQILSSVFFLKSPPFPYKQSTPGQLDTNPPAIRYIFNGLLIDPSHTVD